MIAVPVSPAGRQHAFGGNLRVTQELQRHVLVVFAGIRVGQNSGYLLLVRLTQHKGGVVEGLLRQQGECLRLNFQYLLPLKLGNRNMLAAEEIIFRIVMRQREGS